LQDAVKAAHELVTLTRRFKEAGFDPENRINAFHLAGNERRDTCPPFSEFAPIYERAATEMGMNRNGTHVGEVKPANDIWRALAISEISRLGHGLSAAKDEKLMEEIRNHGVAIEILLTSNSTLLGHKPMDHAIHTFLARSIDVILGSDDPGLLRSSISDEYRKATREFGLTDKQLFGITVNTVRHGFAPWWRRQAVLKQLASFNAEHKLGLADSEFRLDPTPPGKIEGRKSFADSLARRFSYGD
jgi:adenosine deaminase